MAAKQMPAPDAASIRAAEEVVAALRAQDMPRACQLANAALGRGLRHPALFNARALWFERQGQVSAALADFEQTSAYVPGDAGVLGSIGLCLLKLNRLPEAIAAFDATLAIGPDLAQAHYFKAEALAASGDEAAALQAYEKTIALDPNHADALANLAAHAARRRNKEQAKIYALRSLATRPDQPTAVLALATVEIADGEFEAAERHLGTLLADPEFAPAGRAAALSALGDALDGRNRVTEAFAAYTAAKSELRRLHEPHFTGGRAIDSANALIAHFERMPAQRWRSAYRANSAADGPSQHVFLLGFMRSGTTLLEQALASHPQVVAMDEYDFLRDANETFLTSEEGLERLAELGQNESMRWSDAYWKSVRELGIAVDGKVFVDKLPFNTIKLPIIAKLFPTAKILFCLRDPRDVVFSSFRRAFDVNATIFEFLTLEDGARFYAAVMQLAETYRSKLALTLHEHRYEDMVGDFRKSVTAVCDFIGIGWSEGMRDFSETAKTSDIRNPSATQVRRPLFSEGIGQWRRYREQMASTVPALAPWIAKFGYPPD